LSDRGRLNQHVQQVVGAKADFVSGQPNDAWISGTEHLNPRSATKPELVEPVNVLGMAENLGNAGTMPNGKVP